jgi:hypothetical protein
MKPPTFCCNVVSIAISVLDSPSASPRAVLRFGPELSQPWSGPSSPLLPTSRGGRDGGTWHELHVSKVRKRVAPFTASSCLHRNKYWDRVLDAGELQHWLYALSIYHTVKTTSSGGSDALSPRQQYATCFDVLLGPLALSVDWSSAGTERLIAQLSTFLKTVQTIRQEEEDGKQHGASSPHASSGLLTAGAGPCWQQLKCAVPSCDGYILGNPCPGHGDGGRIKCRKTVVTHPCQHYSAHVEVACLPY